MLGQPNRPEARRQGAADGVGDFTPLYKLANAEELRHLDAQRSELDSMRQRTAQYLAFVGSATGFLTGAALRSQEHTTWFYVFASLATIASVASILAALCVFWSIDPKKGRPQEWSFFLRPGATIALIEQQEVPTPTESQLTEWLSRQHAAMVKSNLWPLKVQRRVYIFFMLTGALQLLLWTLVAWCRPA